MTTPDGGFCVMTTIQAPTDAMRALAARLSEAEMGFVVVGDAKGPGAYALDGTAFLSLADQLRGPFDLARALPTGHYTRKNVGYLHAIAAGAPCLYETDDDNAPLPVWQRRGPLVSARPVLDGGWVNVYRCFTDALIWPRGLPLDAVGPSRDHAPALGEVAHYHAPIQQGLANGAPDVDAVWRLLLDTPLQFRQGESVYLPEGAWCPFNSQSTWWWPEAFPLLYLPSFCSFRMTDIWRSFVAQRCLWAMGRGLVFHGPEVFQARNEHDLMRDFDDEIPGYRSNRSIANCLEGLTLDKSPKAVGENLLHCYDALVEAGHFPQEEFDLANVWLSDLKQTLLYD
ncbi:hypothetical protein CKO25_10545 [Thiocapsa imhoffii]|uniref:DUF288 domain-containing protein n=2 Tax=Thiocapsa imhoffii TaxID=382777 RepID=A0A9X0WI94_9GAMM|nr:hypothetical protein [Thiocapsa imhoffii]